MTTCQTCHLVHPCECDLFGPPVQREDTGPAPIRRPLIRRPGGRLSSPWPQWDPEAGQDVQLPASARGAEIEHLYDAAAELKPLLGELARMIPEQDTVLESQIGSHGQHLAPPIPWNAAAAMLFFEIHGDVRTFERLLTVRLWGKAVFRPATDEQTLECIGRLPVLIAHGREKGLDRELDLDDPSNALLRWPRQARLLLGAARTGDAPPTAVPGGARCPECGRTLHLAAGWRALAENTTAQCPSCLDERGRPMSWPVSRWLGTLQRDELVTEADARARYGLTSHIRVWKKRGRIHPYGEDERGVAMFRVSDITALLDAVASEQEPA